jgi:hypothetical protein
MHYAAGMISTVANPKAGLDSRNGTLVASQPSDLHR